MNLSPSEQLEKFSYKETNGEEKIIETAFPTSQSKWKPVQVKLMFTSELFMN
jgi:hypothetical protein